MTAPAYHCCLTSQMLNNLEDMKKYSFRPIKHFQAFKHFSFWRMVNDSDYNSLYRWLACCRCCLSPSSPVCYWLWTGSFIISLTSSVDTHSQSILSPVSRARFWIDNIWNRLDISTIYGIDYVYECIYIIHTSSLFQHTTSWIYYMTEQARSLFWKDMKNKV